MNDESTSTTPQARSARNALDVARDAFRLLVTGPQPLALDGTAFDGLPDRWLPLDVVRGVLLSQRCPMGTADAVWAYLVERSRAAGAAWTVGAVGVALPALTSAASSLSRRCPEDPADVAAEVLRGFLDELSRVDISRPRIVSRLRWAAYRAGHKAVVRAWTDRNACVAGVQPAARPVPEGHPDFVLARAVADGVLSAGDAELIGATRLESVSIAQWAADHDMTRWAAYKARRRAELRLVAYVQDILLDADPHDDLADRAAAAIALDRGLPGDGPEPGLSKADSSRGFQYRGKVSPTAVSSEVRSCA